MIIGVLKEIKAQENRVALLPAGVRTLVAAGHRVLVEEGAGRGSGVEDDEYRVAGAEMVAAAAEVWHRAELVVKVKEPLPPEYPYLREDLIIFTYLHLAPLPELTEALLAAKVIAVAYETVLGSDGSLPLLAPMSEVAGRLAVQAGAHYLEREHGGRGVLLGGVTGVEPGRVVILGGGTVGLNAAQIALGMGATVTVLGRSMEKLATLKARLGGRIEIGLSTPEEIIAALAKADLVVGAVLVVGGQAPKLITRAMLAAMPKRAVIVDVAIDQGGCCETSHPTTHHAPTYEVDEIIHYCVANMPGAVPRTSTQALTHVTLPYLQNIADRGLVEAARADAGLAQGINCWRGVLSNRPVAEAQGRLWREVGEVLG
ncbi:MAG: alanine dehydrogenase [Desulfobulbaceae bacterium]|nr:alanine dehydrogenase [Desulfobulbaceae bacterium]